MSSRQLRVQAFEESGGILQLCESVQYGQCGLRRLLWISEAVSCKKMLLLARSLWLRLTVEFAISQRGQGA